MRCYQELCSAKLLLVLQISHFSFCSAMHWLGLLYTRQGGFPLHPSKPCPTPLCLLNATQVTDRGSVKAKLLSQKLLDRPSLCLKCSSPFNLEICERIGSETECWSIWGTRINLKKYLTDPALNWANINSGKEDWRGDWIIAQSRMLAQLSKLKWFCSAFK